MEIAWDGWLDNPRGNERMEGRADESDNGRTLRGWLLAVCEYLPSGWGHWEEHGRRFRRLGGYQRGPPGLAGIPVTGRPGP